MRFSFFVYLVNRLFYFLASVFLAIILSIFTQSYGTRMTEAVAAMLVFLIKVVYSFVREHQYDGHDVK